jgi:hypothetical protein
MLNRAEKVTYLGTYVPSRRIEMHSIGAGVHALVQVAVESPHLTTWESVPMSTETARETGLLLRLDHEGDRSVPKCLPNIASIAFDHHHNCGHEGALGDCHACYTNAAAVVRAAAEELAIWDVWRAE